MEQIYAANGAKPIGPYTPAIKAGHLVYLSGQTGGIADQDVKLQAEATCKNVAALLEAAGVGFEDVIKTTCFLADIADFAAFNEVYAKYFISKPARSCVAVKDLPGSGNLCEIEVIAYKE